jgi:GTP:adenosylcobinamide-phosphate guanylyltransferase
MKHIHLIIPCAGEGKRFKEAGYTTPKPLIQVAGVPMIRRVVESFVKGVSYIPNLSLASVTIIIDAKQVSEEAILTALKFPQGCGIELNVISVEKPTRGAAETLQIGFESLRNRIPFSVMEKDIFLSADCDTFYLENPLQKISYVWAPASIQSCASEPILNGGCFYFKPGPEEKIIYSYLHARSQTEARDCYIDGVSEKVNPTSMANQGIYFFDYKMMAGSLPHFLKHAPFGELYISAFINHCKLHLAHFFAFEGPRHYCVGTPEQLQGCEVVEDPKTFCFDIDETLMTRPVFPGNYATCQPIPKNIRFVNALHRKGHKIILHTARRMLTHKGDAAAAEKDIGQVTKDKLHEFGVKYDIVTFGKPYADFYIDDKAICAHEDLEKATGFYDIHVAPRSFNSLEVGNVTIVKRGKIEGERYYYPNIPDQVKHLFPKYIGATEDSIEIERLDGIPASYLNARGQLTEENLKRILLALSELHMVAPGQAGLEVLRNEVQRDYQEKFQKRMDELFTKDPIFFKEKVSQVLHKIRDSLVEYSVQRVNPDVLCMVHGDPVLTNVILCRGDAVKFVDMRGKLGAIHTRFGDPVYDYAKVLQSLLGYDSVLQGFQAKPDFSSPLVGVLRHHIHETTIRFSDVITVCQANILTMLPLHEPENRPKFLELIN